MNHNYVTKGVTMKLGAIFSIFLFALTVTSCSTSKSAKTGEFDDRYYSLTDARLENRQLKKLTENRTDDRAVTESNNYDNYKRIPDESGSDSPSTVINNYNYYEADDYYDYMYSSRIRRFHRPIMSGYYSPIYTNMYWYNYDPFCFGTSIYTTYSFFNPYLPWGGPSWGFGWNSWSGLSFGFGYGYGNPYAWSNPWRWGYYGMYHSPFYYNPWGWSPYGFGWSAAYMNPYPAGMMMGLQQNPVYYNSYDYNSYSPVVQGPSTAGGGVGAGAQFKTLSPAQTFSKEIGLAPTAHVPATINTGGKAGAVTTAQPQTEAGKANSLKGAVQQQQTTESARAAGTNTVKGNIDPQTGRIQNNVATKYDNTPGQKATSPSDAARQQGREGLIRAGVVDAEKVKQNNYSSTPANAGRVGNPVETTKSREPNIRQQTVPQVQRYSPAYDMNKGVRSEGAPQDYRRIQDSRQPGTIQNKAPEIQRQQSTAKSYDLPQQRQEQIKRPTRPQQQQPGIESTPRPTPRINQQNNQRYDTPRSTPRMETPRNQSPRMEAPRQSSPSIQSPRMNSNSGSRPQSSPSQSGGNRVSSPRR